MERFLALVVDRDPAVREAIREELELRGVMTLGAESPAEALDPLGTRPIELLFLDATKSDSGRRAVLSAAGRMRRTPTIIGLVAAGGAVEAWPEEGPELFDVVERPLGPRRLRRIVDRFLEHRGLLAEIARLRAELHGRSSHGGLIGRSLALGELRLRISELAGGDAPVWFSGEVGSGKRLAARILHGLSARSERPFVALDCRESGRPAWSSQWNSGRLATDTPVARDLAGGGTLYLDHLLDLPIEAQEELIRHLRAWDEQGEPAAAVAPEAPPRVLAGSSQSPEEALSQGRLLRGLHDRLAVERVAVPPLRARREDIALLARHFLSTICEINQLPPIRLSAETLETLEAHGWPGNADELRNAIEHAAILAADGSIDPGDLPGSVRRGSAERDARADSGRVTSRPFRDAKREVVESFERAYLSELLERHDGNVTLASQQAGMLRSALQRLLRKYGLKSAEYRKPRGGRRRSPDAEGTLD